MISREPSMMLLVVDSLVQSEGLIVLAAASEPNGLAVMRRERRIEAMSGRVKSVGEMRKCKREANWA
ncbi:MAG: hypothetical protein ACYC5Y_03535 [Symbiobacteriia bacterium]